MKRELSITKEPIDEAGLLSKRELSPGMGAVIYFLGVVRGTEENASISAIDYEAFQKMAEHQFNLLFDEIEKRKPSIEGAVALGNHYGRALSEASGFKPYVDKFFDDVRVKSDDARKTQARLRLLRKLEGVILKLADISEIVPDEKQA